MRAAILVLAAACGSSHAPAESPHTPGTAPAASTALPALFAHVPADTPYLVASIDPLQGADLALAQAVIGPALVDGAPKFPRLAKFLEVVRAELGGDWTPERWQALGFLASPRFAIYGIGLYPVLRMEIASGDKVVATLGRIAVREGGALQPPQTRGAYRYWRFDKDLSIVLAIGDHELVLARGPRAQVDASLDEIIGVKLPATSLADGKHLGAILDRHHLGRHFVGIFETRLLIAAAIAQGNVAPSRECRDRLDALSAQVPRFVVGAARNPGRQLTFAAMLELGGDLMDHARAMRTQVPAIARALDGAPIMAFAGAVSLPAAATLVRVISAHLGELGGACAAPDLRSIADTIDPKLDSLSTGLAPTITGFALSVHALTPSTTGSKIPSVLDAVAVVTSTDANQLFTAMMSLQPAMAAFGFTADGALHELNTALLKLPFSIYAGVSDHALVLASGSAEQTRATAALADTSARPIPLVVMTYDYDKFIELERAFGLLTDSEATVQARSKIFGRGTFTVDVDADGLAMWSKIDLK